LYAFDPAIPVRRLAGDGKTREEELNLSKKEIQPGIWVMEMSGNVHMGADCKRVDQEINGHIEKKQLRIIFDLGKVDHIDSAFVGQIVKSFSSLKKVNGKLRLACVKGMVEGVLKMTQVDKVIPVFPTVSSACEDFAE
jgi:anti-sigma B factor antagonist